MKKKILAVILASAMALSFSACTSSEDVQNALNGGINSNNQVNNNNNNNNNFNNNNNDNNFNDNNNNDNNFNNNFNNNNNDNNFNDNNNNDNNFNNNNNNDNNFNDNNDNNNDNNFNDNNQNNGSFTHGQNTRNGYKSDFFNIEIEFDNGWYSLDDDDLASKNGINDMSDNNVQKAFNKTGVLYEMMAQIESNSNIIISVEDLNLTNGGKSLSAEEYLEVAMPKLEDTLKATYGDVELEMSEITLCGKDLPCIIGGITTQNTNGETITAAEVIVAVSKGNYMGIITFTALSEDDLLTLASAFKSIG